MNRVTFLALPLLVLSSFALATVPSDAAQPLKYQTGTLPLLSGKAALTTGQTLRYLDAANARRVIVDIWGNPPQAASDVLGMIVPADLEPDGEDGWGVVVTENTDGHISDDDAAKIDYNELLSQMQQESRDSNAERVKAGYEPVKLIGWAEPPSYDAASHKLIWARELAFGKSDDHTLNYAVRVLGRDRVLELNAVGGLSQLPQIKAGMRQVLSQVSFAPGHTYAEYRAGSDKLANYGVAALVGGLAAKKLGLLAGGLLLLKKGWVLLLAAFAGLRRLFGRRSA
ncbi:DUF2167 domain-containing protein [Deinococcus sp.]|uniref:DUF2167 domain-containing protein n=1 Tax=Deinococcus sp. TaxID=47478 RepID=UPI003B59D5BF